MFLSIVLLICNMIQAQNAGDYYMPLCVDNQTVFYTPQTGGWEGRTTTYTIIKSDSINGVLYYVEEGVEFVFNQYTPPHAFHILWLRKDVNGDILLKAFSETSPVLDSAEILPTELIFFSHNNLTPGFSLTQNIGGTQTSTDSVVSTNATCGSIHNCIQLRQISKDNGVIDNIDDYFYAYGIGRVGDTRIYPSNEAHTDNLIESYVTGCNPIEDTLTTIAIDTCLGQYYDYYLSNILIDTVDNQVTVTWIFIENSVTREFTTTYDYLNEGNHTVGITLNCGKSSAMTFYKNIYIGNSSLGIKEDKQNGLIVNFYPNPTRDKIYISNHNQEEILLMIYDIHGSLVKSEIINKDQAQLDVTSFNNGLYIIEFKTATTDSRQKLIICR